ncbi:MAG TPA: IS1634 family transposase [Chlamydiales bacterium]|nr:IS1634 family transposase [Chlamydiales bacterium]
MRVGNKVRQETIAHLGVVKGQKDLEKLRHLAESLLIRLEKEGLEIDPKIRVRQLMHKMTVYDGFGLVVDQFMKLTGFSEVIKKAQGRRQFDLEEIVKLIIVQRLDLPGSKLRTQQRQTEHGFCEIELQNMYRTMDVIEPLSRAFQQKAFDTVRAYSSGLVDCFFFDVTTLYFESVQQDELKEFGFSKDQKYHSVQVVLALVVDAEGNPLGYEVFKGNLAETKTLIPVFERLKKDFSINNVTVVCDRGLASKTNIEALQNSKFRFVVASKLRSMKKSLKLNDRLLCKPLPNQIHFPEEERVLFRTLPHPQYADTLLIITYSPGRAAKDKEDRERLLEKLREKLDSSTDEASLKKVISNAGYKKYTNIKKGSSLELNQKTIDEDALWDGFHGIAVSNNADLTVEQALSRYKELWHVEEAFRIAKCTLKTRPVFHWKPHRIRSHVLLCFLTLFIERFLEFRLRQAGTPLTPDRIRHALNGVHTTVFEEKDTHREGKMESALSEDAEKIFKLLGLPIARTTSLGQKCCA